MKEDAATTRKEVMRVLREATSCSKQQAREIADLVEQLVHYETEVFCRFATAEEMVAYAALTKRLFAALRALDLDQIDLARPKPDNRALVDFIASRYMEAVINRSVKDADGQITLHCGKVSPWS